MNAFGKQLVALLDAALAGEPEKDTTQDDSNDEPRITAQDVARVRAELLSRTTVMEAR